MALAAGRSAHQGVQGDPCVEDEREGGQMAAARCSDGGQLIAGEAAAFYRPPELF